MSCQNIQQMAKVAIGQIRSTSNISKNLSQCIDLISKASKAGAKALFLPEASDYISSSPTESIALVEPAETGIFVCGIRKAAIECNIAVNVGIHEPTDDRKRVKNTLLWIDGNGNIIKRYQKVHLYDVDLETGPKLKESESVEPGSELIAPFETPVGLIGMLICFDLRFPEPSLHLSQMNPSPSIITYPSAFTIPTGLAHWSTLLKCRAIETQSYVIAAAQVGQHNEKRASYGHSMIVDPWGKVLVELSGDWSGDPDIGFAEIDDEFLQNVRKQIPLNRRWDVYGRV